MVPDNEMTFDKVPAYADKKLWRSEQFPVISALNLR
jgi:hypothetical protein